MNLGITVSVVVLIGLLFYIVSVNVQTRREERNGEWHQHEGWSRAATRMRRWVNGGWQYREMTDAEATEDAVDVTGWGR